MTNHNSSFALNLEEKLRLLMGKDEWHTYPCPSLHLASIRVADGPSGLRVEGEQKDQDSLLKTSLPSVSFPCASLNASSFDPDSFAKLGKAISQEAKALGVNVVLGPGINIKRSPLCGRSFEYLSEDPLVSGQLASSYVQAIQKEGIGACLKHFAANNQETYRSSISVEVDERTLREIYLRPFEIAVKKSQPWAVMSSYNRINGVHSSDNLRLLTDVLRKEWGFEGLVMTDWGGMGDKVKAIKAGTDLEMPFSGRTTLDVALKAYEEQQLSEDEIDSCVRRVKDLVNKCQVEEKPLKPIDFVNDHLLAVELAENGMVLLKNDESFFPLKQDDDFCLIGDCCKHPVFQGEGSSHVNAYKEVSPYEAFLAFKKRLPYAAGYEGKEDNLELIDEAIQLAKKHQKVVLFLADSLITEGVDRTSLNLPSNQLRLLEEICLVNPQVGVILTNGAPVEMPFINSIKGLLECYLPGEGGGEGMADLVFGKVNPSGKLAETFPLKLEDTPSYRYFPGGNQAVWYEEGMYVGYRYYETVGKKVLFPFGAGLSYTKFQYDDCILNGRQLSFSLTNVGSMVGQETYFVFVKKPDGKIYTPSKELIAFCKVKLEKGEKKRLSLELTDEMLKSYDPADQRWEIENGVFTIYLASSVTDIKATFNLFLKGEASANRVEEAEEYFLGRVNNLPSSSFFRHLGHRPLAKDALDPYNALQDDISLKAASKDNKAVQFLLMQLALHTNKTMADLLAMVPLRQYELMLPEEKKEAFKASFELLCQKKGNEEDVKVILSILHSLGSGGRKTQL
ncbi:MAG: glycoside hydrolase family 3 C-terminal domain-containing protein [Bacilli bacterium]|jgi:beta-glucosidase|nr:glycoside hydrolase family 3 C-terminal domain-containing protein [Bacilli bacterium]